MLTLYCIISQNGQAHFKNLAAFVASVPDDFDTLYIPWLSSKSGHILTKIRY